MVTAERNSVKSKAGSDKLPALNLTNISVNLAVEIRISVEKDKSEPVSNWEKVRIIFACPCRTKKIFFGDFMSGTRTPEINYVL